MTKHRFLSVCLLALVGATFAWAKGPSSLLNVTLDSEQVLLQPADDFKAYTVVIAGPSGHFTYTYEGGEHGLIDLFTPEGEFFADGTYTYQITVVPHREVSSVDRNALRYEKSESVTQSGSFSIKDGELVDSAQSETNLRSALIENINDQDDPHAQVIATDLIVQGSACVGLDCVNGESFGFDTLRLKENNLRIKFQDTSVSASFPTNDWQITANDTTNGGLNKFSIDDIDGGRTPFTIEASAPSHALYVDDGGRVGLGTSTPVVELHVVNGDSPTMRLEQDGSSGFTPQTWDVAGNETNFFVRDATNGSPLPFRIRPSAPQNSLYIDTDGDIGIGTASPSAQLDIQTGDIEVNEGNVILNQGVINVSDNVLKTAVGVDATLKLSYTGADNDTHQLLRLFSNGQVNQSFTDTVNNITWRLAMFGGTGNNDDNFQITRAGVLITPFRIDQNGNGVFNGTVTANGAVLTSDVNQKENFAAVDSQEILSKVASLPLSQWNFKDREGVQHFGPMAQDFFNAFGYGHDDKHIDVTDSMGVALGAIQGLNELVVEKDAKIEALTKLLAEQNAALKAQDARLKALESKLQD